jgi:hypothetical protein
MLNPLGSFLYGGAWTAELAVGASTVRVGGLQQAAARLATCGPVLTTDAGVQRRGRPTELMARAAVVCDRGAHVVGLRLGSRPS